MKTLLSLLLLAIASLPALAANDYINHSAGSTIGSTDVTLFETAGGLTYKIPFSQVVAQAQVGTVSSTSTVTLGGDATGAITFGGGTSTLTLATVNSNTGTYTDPTIVVNSKGLVLGISSNTRVNSLNSQTGAVVLAVTGTGSGAASVSAATNTVTINIPTPATYTLPAATISALGGVIADNTTTVVNGSGVISVGTITFAQVGSRPTSAAGYGISNGATLDTIAAGNPFTFSGGLSATGTWPNLTISSSAGGVTSIAVAVPTGFTVSGSPITSAGTITIGLANASANTVWAGPASGSAAAPTLRALVSADIPNNAASTSSTAANLSGTPALPNGTAATTQTGSDNTTKVATDAFVQTVVTALPSGAWTVDNTATFTATANQKIAVDTVTMFSNGVSSATITLPSAPPDGTTVTVYDPFGTGNSHGGFANIPITVVKSTPDAFYTPTSGGSTSGPVVLSRNYQMAVFYYWHGNQIWSVGYPGQPLVFTGTLASGSASVTVPTGAACLVQDTASSPSGPMSVTVSGTSASVHGTGSDTFTLFAH